MTAHSYVNGCVCLCRFCTIISVLAPHSVFIFIRISVGNDEFIWRALKYLQSIESVHLCPNFTQPIAEYLLFDSDIEFPPFYFHFIRLLSTIHFILFSDWPFFII